MIIEVLNILSFLARIFEDYYEPIHNLNIYKDLALLIKLKDPTI